MFYIERRCPAVPGASVARARVDSGSDRTRGSDELRNGPSGPLYLAGETEAWEIIYFKLYRSQLPVVEQSPETAALMLGTDKSRGYCLEMICADFLAGAKLEMQPRK
jgi:hypothetical protein